MAKPFLGVLAALALAGMTVHGAHAQYSLTSRLANERLANVEPGTYQAGDNLDFTLNRDHGRYLLRFADSPEVFVLYAANASLGGRVLKYDSGETAFRVAGWGGLTLYTDRRPAGLPVVRTGAADRPSLPKVSMADMKAAASDETRHLAYEQHLHVDFQPDWKTLAGDAGQRALCFDTLENTARGIERFAALADGHKALKARVRAVVFTTSAKPTLDLKGKSLIVTYVPGKGYAGRASSRAIARALGILFHVATKPR